MTLTHNQSILQLTEEELLNLPEHLSSPSPFSWGSCRSIFRFLCSFFPFVLFSFGDCINCPYSNYCFWLLLWYLQLFSYMFYPQSTRQLFIVCKLLTYPFRHLFVSSQMTLFAVSNYYIGFRVTRSLVLNVCFVDRCLSFCTFSFGHCVVCSSSIYGFWLPLWYL